DGPDRRRHGRLLQGRRAGRDLRQPPEPGRSAERPWSLHYYALQGMQADANGDGSIDVQELFDYLKPQVQRVARRTYNTEQVPQLIIPPALAVQAPPRLMEHK